MAKVKRVRTIDAVVAGWRPGKEPGHGRRADPRPVRRPRAARRRALLGLTASRSAGSCRFSRPSRPGERGSADPSRWSSGRDLEWVALRPELVVEIDFDHVSAGRIRHGAKLRRWREDKARARVHVRISCPDVSGSSSSDSIKGADGSAGDAGGLGS